MAKLLWKSLLVSPAVLAATLVVSSAGFAAEAGAGKAAQPQTTESKLPEAQSVALSTAETSAEALKGVETVQGSSLPTTSAEFEIPKQVAVTTNSVGTAAPAEVLNNVEMSNGASVPMTVPAQTTVAQTPPDAASQTDTSILDQINRYSREGNANSQGQVTNVSQLSDVQPTDWAYESLTLLIQNYGCIAGYPDGTFRGNRAMSRYEFAAGLNACLSKIEELIAARTVDFVTKEDLAILQRLIDEFGAELATLRTRVDNLEGRVTTLEGDQFSTTTKLVGEAIFALSDEFGSDIENNTVFGDRVRLDLQSSFTGKDILHTRLAAGNLQSFTERVTQDALDPLLGLGYEGGQTFNITGTGDFGNDIKLDWLAYEFGLGSSSVYVAATGGLHADYAPVLNPYFYNGDGGNGALSSFAQQSPIYRIGGGAGAGVRLGVGKAPLLGPTSLSIGYLADQANNPGEDTGFFNGDYSALAQLNFTVNDRIGLAATYVHGYHNQGINDDNAIFDIGGGTGIVGTGFANLPGTRSNTPVVSNSYGVQAAFRLSDRISISGFAMYSDIIAINDGDGEIWSYGLGLAFPDLGKKGNLLGLFAGREPYLGSLRIDGARVGGGVLPTDESFHFEGFYKYQLTDNISITPGVIWITNPNQDEGNEDAIIGTLRTTFTF